jgi:hypothetical protein
MTHAQQMVRTNPSSAAVDEATLVECIEACFDCAQACTACADACLGEENPKEMARCIRLDLDCADVCGAMGRILSRQTAFEPAMVRAALQACAEACRLCGEECEHHASEMSMEHCRACGEACRRCEAACNNVLSAIAA